MDETPPFVERNRKASIPLDVWESEMFGPRPPDYIPVPDYLGEDNDAPAMRAYYAEWGATITANNAAALAHSTAHKLRREKRRQELATAADRHEADRSSPNLEDVT
jgi:hypothetical protein